MGVSTPTRTAAQSASLNDAFTRGIALNRPFEATDVTASSILSQAARVYAQTYTGTWQFMADMREASLQGFLTPGQSKGVLNCLMADGRKARAAKAKLATPAATASAPAPVALGASAIPDGTYTVVLNPADPTDYTTIRIKANRDKTKRHLTYLMGADNTADFSYFGTITEDRVWTKSGFLRQARALDVVLRGDHLAELGAAYALLSGCCYRCGRLLTRPSSIYSGMGEDCADKAGAAYGPPPATVSAPAPVAAPVAAVAVAAPVTPTVNTWRADLDVIEAAEAAAVVPIGAAGRAAWVKRKLGLDDLITAEDLADEAGAAA